MRVFGKVKKILVAAVLCAAAGTSAFALPVIPQSELCAADENGSPFIFNPWLDGGLLATGAAGTGAGLLFKNSAKLPEWDGTVFDLSQENFLDAYFAHPYSYPLHMVGTATCGFDLCILPAGIFGTELILGNLPLLEAGKIGMMYAESFLLSCTIKDNLKVAVHRVRPYMYFENNGYKEGINDWQFSFPSGHTTNAFLGAGFLSYVFCHYYPDSKFKVPVVATAYSLAVSTGALRVLSGNHFVTDVLTGAAIGSVCGIGVPLLHHVLAENTALAGIAKNVSVSPVGVSFSFKF